MMYFDSHCRLKHFIIIDKYIKNYQSDRLWNGQNYPRKKHFKNSALSSRYRREYNAVGINRTRSVASNDLAMLTLRYAR